MASHFLFLVRGSRNSFWGKALYSSESNQAHASVIELHKQLHAAGTLWSCCTNIYSRFSSVNILLFSTASQAPVINLNTFVARVVASGWRLGGMKGLFYSLHFPKENPPVHVF